MLFHPHSILYGPMIILNNPKVHLKCVGPIYLYILTLQRNMKFGKLLHYLDMYMYIETEGQNSLCVIQQSMSLLSSHSF